MVAFKTQDRGASGLDINGQRPTSPGAWNVIKDSLRTNKVWPHATAHVACGGEPWRMCGLGVLGREKG